MPVLVDEDWGDDLLGHVARLLRPEEVKRAPTSRMTRTLGAQGRLCVLVDSLSERGVENAEQQVTPHELDTEYLRGVLAGKADELPFRDVSGEKDVKPAALVEMLIRSGVLNRNRANRRFVQFTYDPVAEQLAAMV